MAAPKKPESTIDQIVSVLKDMISEPMTDQSSVPPTAADVRRVKSRMRGPAARKKKPTKARVRPAAKKKRAATRKKVSAKKVTARKVTRKKATRKKPSRKR